MIIVAVYKPVLELNHHSVSGSLVSVMMALQRFLFMGGGACEQCVIMRLVQHCITASLSISTCFWCCVRNARRSFFFVMSRVADFFCVGSYLCCLWPQILQSLHPSQ